MTELPSSLELYREQLHGSIGRDLGRRRGGRRAAILAIPAAGIAAVAVAVVSAISTGPQVSSADAAVLRHVTAALSAPAGSIIHERAMVTANGRPASLFELWEQTAPPHHYHVIKWGHEGYGTSRMPDDPAATLRRLVQSGKATVDETTFDGVPAYKLTVSGAPRPFLDGTSYVRRSNYQPLEIDTSGNGGEVIRYQAYEYLPSTPANLALVSRAH